MPESQRERERWREALTERERGMVGLMVAGEEAGGDPAGELAPLLGMADGPHLMHLPDSRSDFIFIIII